MLNQISKLLYSLALFFTLVGSALSNSEFECDNCSRFIELNRLKANCFQKYFEKQNLLVKFEDKSVVSVQVNLNCKPKTRSVIPAPSTIEHDPDLHYLTKDAIKCLYRLVSEETTTFNPSRIISFQKHCSNG